MGAGEVVKLYCSFIFNGIMGVNQSLIAKFYSTEKKPPTLNRRFE
jgi:hypothetical protein